MKTDMVIRVGKVEFKNGNKVWDISEIMLDFLNHCPMQKRTPLLLKLPLHQQKRLINYYLYKYIRVKFPVDNWNIKGGKWVQVENGFAWQFIDDETGAQQIISNDWFFERINGINIHDYLALKQYYDEQLWHVSAYTRIPKSCKIDKGGAE